MGEMHSLILGTTGSGKTEFAKDLASDNYRRGNIVLVCDPFRDKWAAHLNTPDVEYFMRAARKNRNALCIVDESGSIVGQHNDETFWLATELRHYGSSCIFIAQRHSQISPVVRGQCHNLFLFRVDPDSAKILSKEFVSQEASAAPSLEQYHCYWIQRFGTARELNLDRRARQNVIPFHQRRYA